jgi:DNA-binding MarR family transcriptional regulator
MSIEKDIKQKTFKNPYNKLTVNLMYTNGWLTNQYAKILKPYNLTEQQSYVLKILRDNYPQSVTVNYIIENMIDEMSNVSRLVDKLIAKKLVVKEKSIHDLRSLDVKLTEAGVVFFDEMSEKVVKWEESFFEANESDLRLLNSLLIRLREK